MWVTNWSLHCPFAEISTYRLLRSCGTCQKSRQEYFFGKEGGFLETVSSSILLMRQRSCWIALFWSLRSKWDFNMNAHPWEILRWMLFPENSTPKNFCLLGIKLKQTTKLGWKKSHLWGTYSVNTVFRTTQKGRSYFSDENPIRQISTWAIHWHDHIYVYIHPNVPDSTPTTSDSQLILDLVQPQHFQELKHRLPQEPLLKYFDINNPVTLTMDARS